MAAYDYKIIKWSVYDDLSVKETINQETSGDWEYYDGVHIHDGRVELVFRQNTENQ